MNPGSATLLLSDQGNLLKSLGTQGLLSAQWEGISQCGLAISTLLIGNKICLPALPFFPGELFPTVFLSSSLPPPYLTSDHSSFLIIGPIN